ncbi:MAG: flavin monoamine oxidase family protein, partial [Bdellovibrionales bacterium]
DTSCGVEKTYFMSRTRLFAQLKSAFHRAQLPHSYALQTRREFLKTSAAATVAAAVAYRQPFLTALPSDPVLILGAGAAGLAAAYSLQKAGIPFRVLEASQRVGGRILTQYGFTDDGQFIERGGELIDSDHSALLTLAAELGLKTERVEAADSGLKTILYSFRGQIYTDKDIDLHIHPLLKAVDDARKDGAGPVTYKDSLNGNARALKWDRISLQEFLDSTRGHVSEWLREIVAVGYMGEFGRPASEISVLSLINLIAGPEGGLYGPSDESTRIVGGNSWLPNALAAAIEVKNPGAVELGARVMSLADRGGKIQVSYQINGSIKEAQASRVICTVPFSVLRMVDGLKTLGLSQQKLACIQKLAYGSNSKTMMEFTSKPWRQGNSKVPAYNGAICGDFQSQSFWESSRKQKGKNGILTCFQGGDSGINANSRQVHTTLLPDLEKILPGIAGTYIKSAVQNWNLVPEVYGSYACLLAGQYGEINGAQPESELDGRLLFAGEHASDESQGYMNGAVETGVAAATEIIKKMAAAPSV